MRLAALVRRDAGKPRWSERANDAVGIAIALILALLAALVGPYFVNWNDHRAFFEAEASRLVGLNVQVAGADQGQRAAVAGGDARRHRDRSGRRGQPAARRARSSIELGLGALMRGEIRAVETRLVGPQFSIGLNSLGQIDWPPMALHDRDRWRSSGSASRTAASSLTDAASNSRLVLDKLWFSRPGALADRSVPRRGRVRQRRRDLRLQDHRRPARRRRHRGQAQRRDRRAAARHRSRRHARRSTAARRGSTARWRCRGRPARSRRAAGRSPTSRGG